MKKIMIVIMMILVSSSVNATGNMVTGKTLFKYSKARQDTPKREQYEGYVVGVADAFANSDVLCIPSGTEPGRIVEIVTKNLRLYNKTLDLKSIPGPTLIKSILINFYPC